VSRKHNKLMSELAIAHVKACLPKGAANRVGGTRRELKTALHALSYQRASDSMREDRTVSLEQRIPGIVAGALAEGAGNCGEQSILAFVFLKKKGVYPLELISGRTERTYYDGRPSDHGFVVIGRALNSQLTAPETWGDEAVVCDPWNGQTLKPRELFSNMFDQSWSFTVDASVVPGHSAKESPFA